MDPSVLERIQAYVRRYAIEQRRVERSGPFLATFGRYSNGPYLNYAVPDDHCIAAFYLFLAGKTKEGNQQLLKVGAPGDAVRALFGLPPH